MRRLARLSPIFFSPSFFFRRWKDKANPLRTSPEFRLTGVPTLLQWGTQKRLVEEDCADAGKVELFFED